MCKLDRLGWAGSLTLHLGRYLIGVRYNDDGIADLLHRAFPRRVVAGPAPSNFSVRIGDVTTGPRRGAHVLYQSSRLVARTDKAWALHRALLSWLCAYLDDDRVGLLRVPLLAVVRERRAVLLSMFWQPSTVKIEPVLRRRGIRMLNAPFATLDLTTKELVVDAVPLGVDAAVGPDLLADSEDAHAGRFAIVGRVNATFSGAMTAAGEAMELFRAIDRVDERTREAAFDRVAELMDAVPSTALESTIGTRALADTVTRLLDG